MSGVNLLYTSLLMIVYYLINAFFFISFNVLVYLFISMNTSMLKKSLSVCLLFWLFFCIIYPSSSWIIGKKLNPVNSKNEVIQLEKSSLIDERSLSWGNTRQINNDILSYKDEVDRNTLMHNKIWSNYTNNLFNQYKICRKISHLSPFSVFQSIGTKISNTGVDGYVNFYEQVLKYQNNFTVFIREEDRKDKNSTHVFWNKIDTNQGFISNKKLLINEIPKFSFRIPTLFEMLKSTRMEFILILCWNIVLLFFIIIQINRTRNALYK